MNKWIITICVLLGVLLLFGCTSSKYTSDSNNTTKNFIKEIPNLDVKFISGLQSDISDGNVSLWFSLMDKQQNDVVSNGTAVVRMINKKGDEIYNKTFVMREDDFGYYKNPLTGVKSIKYIISIPLTDINLSNGAISKTFVKVSSISWSFDEISG